MLRNSVNFDSTALAAAKRPDYISPLDDLAFVMYQDPEISQIIRSLDKKKCDCVIGEPSFEKGFIFFNYFINFDFN